MISLRPGAMDTCKGIYINCKRFLVMNYKTMSLALITEIVYMEGGGASTTHIDFS